MTPKQRVLQRLDGAPVDRTPNLCIVMLFAAYYAGIPYGRYCSKYRSLVEAQVKTAEDFGLDVLSTMSDPFCETADFGSTVIFQPDNLPVCKGPLVTGPQDFGKVKPFDPLQPGGRIHNRVKAIEFFKQLKGDEYPVLGWVEGAFAQFANLATISEAMMLMVDEADEVQLLLERIATQEIACAKAQVEAGADIIGIGDAAAALISPAMYSEMVLPLEIRMVQEIQAMGAKVKLHICGNITHILPKVLSTGADIVDIDYPVDFETAIQQANGSCAVNGNFNPTVVLLQGNPQLVRKEAKRCMLQGGARSMVSAGCEVPKMTPPQNLMAVTEQLKEGLQ